ncbi:thymidylate kinase [Pseudostreptobacillus hongkongensis]|uniref:dTMP kinase n=1 Tax=Pseudostreptobacillus hongkongensis TaxID=1162717 RepID=UPI0028D44CBD|nr:thymidylate kinase [Pseudostreptobacillus hongkongensis]
MSKLIIIEGTDGSGKQTQSQKLYERLVHDNLKVKKISFPDYDSDSSSLVKMYLNGDFGKKPEDVNPYTASSFYGVDRFASYKMKWEKEYKDGYYIISDRYTTSNMVHQCSKISDSKDKNDFLTWLEDFEYNKLELPKPNMVIFLNVPIDYTFNLMKNRENKITGEEKKDIHESNVQYLKNSYYNALEIAKNKGWIIVDCVENNEMKTIDEIHELIYSKIKEEFNEV